ncbi:hypothetical protein RRG08_044229 [Elysia crispata]|uniref:Uncharacterized protein n=1 Tax=Elysia crispata TaxID=231223 RepID=A0AAE0XWP2_9GAST|nr:hypothetical protein RRG08_044229 [Elysia crispata]
MSTELVETQEGGCGKKDREMREDGGICVTLRLEDPGICLYYPDTSLKDDKPGIAPHGVTGGVWDILKFTSNMAICARVRSLLSSDLPLVTSDPLYLIPVVVRSRADMRAHYEQHNIGKS